MVDVYRAVHHTTEVSPSALYLNDTRHAKLQQTIQITNVGKELQTYTVSHLAAGSILPMNASSKSWLPFPVPVDAHAVTVEINPVGLALNPGQSSTVTLTFTPPSLDAASIPIYSGWISISSKENSEVGAASIPYFGVGADMAEENVFGDDSSSGFSTPYLSDQYFIPVYNDSTVFTQELDDTGFFPDSPGIVAHFRLGVRRVTIDLVSADTSYRPSLPIVGPPVQQTAAQNDARQLRTHPRAFNPGTQSDAAVGARAAAKRSGGLYDDVPVIGRVYEAEYLPRDPSGVVVFGISLGQTILGGSDRQQEVAVGNGRYRLLLRVAKLLQADLSQEDSYESYLSHAFEIRHPVNATSQNRASHVSLVH